MTAVATTVTTQIAHALADFEGKVYPVVGANTNTLPSALAAGTDRRDTNTRRQPGYNADGNLDGRSSTARKIKSLRVGFSRNATLLGKERYVAGRISRMLFPTLPVPNPNGGKHANIRPEHRSNAFDKRHTSYRINEHFNMGGDLDKRKKLYTLVLEVIRILSGPAPAGTVAAVVVPAAPAVLVLPALPMPVVDPNVATAARAA